MAEEDLVSYSSKSLNSQVSEDVINLWHEAGLLTFQPFCVIQKIITVWQSRKAKVKRTLSNVSPQSQKPKKQLQQNEATEAENPKREPQTSTLQSTLEAA
jgi:hypothetical protein